MKKYCLFFTLVLLSSAVTKAMTEDSVERPVASSTSIPTTIDLEGFPGSDYAPQNLEGTRVSVEFDPATEQASEIPSQTKAQASLQTQPVDAPLSSVEVSNAVRYPLIATLSLGIAFVAFKVCHNLAK
jgi:hypothetical protein